MTLTVEQQRIVEENLGLVRAVLSRCVSSPGSTGIYSYDDLFQIGCIALCEAVIEYQPGRAVFSTYAFVAIRNRIYNALACATYRRKREKQSDFPNERLEKCMERMRTMSLLGFLKPVKHSDSM